MRCGWVLAQALEALEREREVDAALRAGDRVDLVDDHRANAAEHAAAAHAREHDVQRLGRRDENVRRLAQHARARRRRRVARANGDANLGKRLARRGEALAQLGERLLEVALDVVVQRLERRDVEDVNRVRQRLTQSVDDELVQLPEKRRERLAGAGGREDERVRPARDRGPAFALWRAWRAERVAKPRSDEWMEGLEAGGTRSRTPEH